MAAEKISGTSEKRFLRERKSWRDFLENPKTAKSSCSLRVERSQLPRINEARIGQNVRSWRQTESAVASNSEISLPKMRNSSGTDSVPGNSGHDSPRSSLSRKASVPGTAACACFSGNGVDIVGPSECRSSFRVSNSDVNDQTVYVDDTVGEENKALKNWEEWMKLRRRQNNRFSEKTKRDKCRLVMNAAEDVRQIKEEKSLLTYARMESPDKWRGHPSFWKEPAALAAGRGVRSEYFARTTASERGVVPPLEFVSVPDAIKIEKDVYCGDRLDENAWNKSKYREEQNKKYAKYLKEIAPHKIEANDLIVVGEKIKPDDKSSSPEVIPVPVIEITPPEESAAPSGTGDSVVILVINGTEMKMLENEEENDENHVWSLVFEKAPTGIITEKILFVENRGTVAVQYEWVYRDPDRKIELPKRKNRIYESCFFFDKNPGIFLPGQKRELKFYHHSKSPGYHSETWHLKLKPSLFKNGQVRLTAIAENAATVEDFLKIDKYLDSCMISSVVNQMVDEIFERSKPDLPRPIEYRSLFMEEELFEFQNPAHYFRYDVVGELKSLFREVPLGVPEEWDLNLFTLEDLIRTYVTGESRRTMLCKLMELTRILLRPGPECYKFNKKHKMLHNVLCGAVDNIETNTRRIRDAFSRLDGFYADYPQNEEGATLSPSSRSSRISEFEENLQEKDISQKSVFQISCQNMFCYRYAIYVTFFNRLCEAVEEAAGIIESCRLFEHDGEVISLENANVMLEDLQ